MASPILLHSRFLRSQPLTSIRETRHSHPNTKFLVITCKQDNGGHDSVDENMIVLRKRIHETKMVEMNYVPPSHWMDWEKKCYTSYDAYVCEVVGVLQSVLMNIRPSLALGFLALITLSVPLSTVVVVSAAMETAKEVLSGILH